MATADQTPAREDGYVENEITIAGHGMTIPWIEGPVMVGRCTPNSHLIRFQGIGIVHMRDPHLGTLETPISRPYVERTYVKTNPHIHVITATEAARLYHAQCPYTNCHQAERKHLEWKKILGDCAQVMKPPMINTDKQDRNKTRKRYLIKEGTRYDLVLIFHDIQGSQRNGCPCWAHEKNDLQEGHVKWLRSEHVKLMGKVENNLRTLVNNGVDVLLSPLVRQEYVVNRYNTPILARDKLVETAGKLAGTPVTLFNRVVQILHHSKFRNLQKLPKKLVEEVQEIIDNQQRVVCELEQCNLQQRTRAMLLDMTQMDHALSSQDARAALTALERATRTTNREEQRT